MVSSILCMLELSIELLRSSNTPPLTVTGSTYRLTITRLVTHVTPYSTGNRGIPLPGLLAIVIRSQEANGHLQLGSHLQGEPLRSLNLLTVLVDVAEINRLIGVRATGRYEVEHTTGSTAGEFELRAIGLQIVDIDARHTGNVVLNPVTVGSLLVAGNVAGLVLDGIILRERSAAQQLLGRNISHVEALLLLLGVTSRQRT